MGDLGGVRLELLHYEGPVNLDLGVLFLSGNNFREGQRSFLEKKLGFGGVRVAEKMQGYKSLGTNQSFHKISNKEEAPLKGIHHRRRSQEAEKQEQDLCTPEDCHVRITGTVEDRTESARGSDGGKGLTP